MRTLPLKRYLPGCKPATQMKVSRPVAQCHALRLIMSAETDTKVLFSSLCLLLNVSLSSGLNRTLVYTLADSVDELFSIDPVSGMVILEKSLDRESQDSYRLRVQATDQAGQRGALSSQVGGSSNRFRTSVSLQYDH